MTLIEAETNGEPSLETSAPPPKSNGPVIPDWVSEEYFIDILEEQVDGFKKILDFEVKPAAGGGENYASIMLRVKVKLELEDGTTKDVAFMVKTIPQGEASAMMVGSMSLFPKETEMYSKYLPEFKEIYDKIGQNVTFGPKFYSLRKDPGAQYVILEDLAPLGFKNLNRLEGLDKQHTEAVLELLAKLHSASAIRFENKGVYAENFMQGMFNESSREIFETMMEPFKGNIIKALERYGPRYSSKIQKCVDVMVDEMIRLGKPNNDEFNVLNHGDLWANNIMFRHNDEGKLEETIFVDFQLCRYGSPSADLYYFLLSSTNLNLKTSHFDYFVKYYHDHLVENLQLLNYPKRIPLLKELRTQLIAHSFWGFSTITGVMTAVLLDPTENASMDNFVHEGEEGQEFRRLMYSNPRYIRHMEAILPWMDTLGLLE